jgi:hypothetical protein
MQQQHWLRASLSATPGCVRLADPCAIYSEGHRGRIVGLICLYQSAQRISIEVKAQNLRTDRVGQAQLCCPIWHLPRPREKAGRPDLGKGGSKPQSSSIRDLYLEITCTQTLHVGKEQRSRAGNSLGRC